MSKKLLAKVKLEKSVMDSKGIGRQRLHSKGKNISKLRSLSAKTIKSSCLSNEN